MNNFKDTTSAQLLDIILQGNEQSDEAMCFVLKKRVGEQLKEKFKTHEHVFFEEFEDVVDDFFLYLREGKGKVSEPYHALRTIVNKDAFEGWLVSTFRNYLNNRGQAEEQTCELNEHQIKAEEESTHNQELLINKVAHLIAYSHQIFFPRGRFVFLRALLTLLNKDNALPDKEMAARIDDDFCSLYPILIQYYNSTLKKLKQEPQITTLRLKHYELTGTILHEDNSIYDILNIKGFWSKLNRWMVK